LKTKIVNIDNLLQVRKTYNIFWKILTFTIFIFYFYGIWCIFHLIPPEKLDIFQTEYSLRTYIALSLLILLGIYFTIIKNSFSRFFFALAFGIIGLFTLIFCLFFVYQTIANSFICCLVIFLSLYFSWNLSLKYSRILWISILPISKWKKYKEQIDFSLKISKKREETEQLNTLKNKLKRPTNLVYLMSLLTLITVSILFFLIALIAADNPDVIKKIHFGKFKEAIFNIYNYNASFSYAARSRSSFWQHLRWPLLYIIISFLILYLFGFIWDKWRRLKILKSYGSISRRVSTNGILYIRSFRGEIARIRSKLIRFPFNIYEWNYSFEEIIVKRFLVVGNIFALVRPNQKLPPVGATRLYLKDNNTWESEIKSAMKGAKIIVAVIGIGEQLINKEFVWLNDLNCMNKTIFLMPPLQNFFKQNVTSVWERFAIETLKISVNKTDELRKQAKNIRAVCFCNNNPVIITSSGFNEFYYESVIDIALGYMEKNNIQIL
jgi:hypothetical protein